MSYKKTKEPHKLMMKSWMGGGEHKRSDGPRRAPSPAADLPRSPRRNLDTQVQGVNLPRVRKRKAHEGEPKEIRCSKEINNV